MQTPLRLARLLVAIFMLLPLSAGASGDVFATLMYLRLGQPEKEMLSTMAERGFRLEYGPSSNPIHPGENHYTFRAERTVTYGTVPVWSVDVTSHNKLVTQILMYLGDVPKGYVPPHTWETMIGRLSAATGHEPMLMSQFTHSDKVVYWTRGGRELQLHYESRGSGYVVLVHLLDRVAAGLKIGVASVPPQDLK